MSSLIYFWKDVRGIKGSFREGFMGEEYVLGRQLQAARWFIRMLPDKRKKKGGRHCEL